MIGQLKLLAGLYWRPFSSMSALLDEGNWVFGAVLVVLLSAVLQYTLVTRQQDAIREFAPVHTAPAAEETTPQADVPRIHTPLYCGNMRRIKLRIAHSVEDFCKENILLTVLLREIADGWLHHSPCTRMDHHVRLWCIFVLFFYHLATIVVYEH